MVRDYVDEVVTVSEEEIVAAMRVCFERMKARSRLFWQILPCPMRRARTECRLL